MGNPAIELRAQPETLQTDLENSFSSLAYMSGGFDGVFALFGDSGADTLDLSTDLNSANPDLSHVLGLSETPSDHQHPVFTTNNHPTDDPTAYNSAALETNGKILYTSPDPGGTSSQLGFLAPSDHSGTSMSGVATGFNGGACSPFSATQEKSIGGDTVASQQLHLHQDPEVHNCIASEKIKQQFQRLQSDAINSYDIDATQILNDIAWQMTHSRQDFNTYSQNSNSVNSRISVGHPDGRDLNSSRRPMSPLNDSLSPIIQDSLRSRQNFFSNNSIQSTPSLVSTSQPNGEDGLSRRDLNATLNALKNPSMENNVRSDEASLGSSSSTATSRESKRPRRRSEGLGSYQDGRGGGSKHHNDDTGALRPGLNEAILTQLNDLSAFKDEKYRKLMADYSENISFPLGEGGRELLRACLNVRGCKGRKLQGASVPTLLKLAKVWDLWNIALRIKVERTTGELCPEHEAFVRFKASQSQMRKYIKKEYMVTERDKCGKISRIVYDENRKITLGKEGREALRSQLRRLHDKHAHEMDKLLERRGLKYSELRNATVQQLAHMAYICNLWPQVEHACRKQEEKRDWKCRESFGNERGGPSSVDDSSSDFISLYKRSRLLTDSPRGDQSLYSQGSFESSEELSTKNYNSNKTDHRRHPSTLHSEDRRHRSAENGDPQRSTSSTASHIQSPEDKFVAEEHGITPASVDQLFDDSRLTIQQNIDRRPITGSVNANEPLLLENSSGSDPRHDSRHDPRRTAGRSEPDAVSTSASSLDLGHAYGEDGSPLSAESPSSRQLLDQYSLELFRENFGQFETELPLLFTPPSANSSVTNTMATPPGSSSICGALQ